MTDFRIRFSCLLHVGSPANAARALDAYVALSEGGLWGFSYARIADRPEPDVVGGGAHLLDLGAGRTLASVDAIRWLTDRLSDAEADHA